MCCNFPFHFFNNSYILQNFTAIIGPNGSGKSNVIDSLLFVFGYKVYSSKYSVSFLKLPCHSFCGISRHPKFALRNYRSLYTLQEAMMTLTVVQLKYSSNKLLIRYFSFFSHIVFIYNLRSILLLFCWKFPPKKNRGEKWSSLLFRMDALKLLKAVNSAFHEQRTRTTIVFMPGMER